LKSSCSKKGAFFAPGTAPSGAGPKNPKMTVFEIKLFQPSLHPE